MTNEERDLITRFIERVGGAAPSGFGSVPSTGQPSAAAGLAPVDPEADALIGQLMAKSPEARYRITQLAFVQEHALNAAQQRIAALQAQLQQAQGQLQAAAQPQAAAPSPWGAGAQPQQPQSRGLFGNLFGGGSPAAPHPAYQAPPQYAPPGGMFQPQGSGFLGGALRTAAGVAGGLVAGQALMNLFSGHGGGFGGFGSGAAMPGAGAEPAGLGTPGGWVDAGPGGGAAPDPYDQGGALKTDPGADPFAQGAADNSAWTSVPDPAGPDTGWQQAASDNGGWQDAPPDDGGNFDSGDDDGGWTDSSSDA